MDKYLTYSVVERKDPQNPGDTCGRDGGAHSSGGRGGRLAGQRRNSAPGRIGLAVGKPER